jgi:osmoprotectant transport system permease protein
MMEEIQYQLTFLPERLTAHILLSTVSLLIGIVISIPLGMAVTRFAKLQSPVLGVASVLQTIPGLAMIALTFAAIGRIGVAPALFALTLYSILPILRNTVTGLKNVDPDLLEAAQGMGMTPWQTLTRIQFPLAIPVIIAGIRTASVWVVGTATLGTVVGATSLGNYIFAGVQTRNNVAVLIGCVAAAGLAISLDALFGQLEHGVRARSRLRTGVVVAGLAIIMAGGIAGRGTTHPIIIGSKTFTEQYILASLLHQRLENAGIAATVSSGLGSTVIFDALVQGEIDCYVDYSGTIWANAMKREDLPSRDTVLAEMSRWLNETHGARCLGTLGFENAYALAMRRDRAESLGIESVEDLARHARDLRMGSDYEFIDRPEWQNLRATYRLQFNEQVTMDPSLMYKAVSVEEVDVISAFSTDGRIAAYDLKVLADPQQALPPYDAVLLLSARAAENDGLVLALSPLIEGISGDAMREANMWVDEERKSEDWAARMLNERLMASESGMANR